MAAKHLALRLAQYKESAHVSSLVFPLSQVITPRGEASLVPRPPPSQQTVLIWEEWISTLFVASLVTQGHGNVRFAGHGGAIQERCQRAASAPGIEIPRSSNENIWAPPSRLSFM